MSALGTVAWNRGELERARAFHRESGSLARRFGRMADLAIALNNEGAICFSEGDLEEARALFADGLAVARDAGADVPAGFALLSLGGLALFVDGPRHAASRLAESLEIFAQVSFVERIATCYVGLATVAVALGEARQAALLLGAAAALRDPTGATVDPPERAVLEATTENTLSELGESEFKAAYAAGLSAAPKEVEREALEAARRWAQE